MLVAPLTTTAMHATSSMDGNVNGGRRRSNIDATTIASASASSMINNAATTDATTVLHHNPLLHARARNRSASTASGPSPLGCDKPTGRVASGLGASRCTMETEIQ